jgi:hypothetical protein
MTVDISCGKVERHVGAIDDWVIHLADTGHETNTGGRFIIPIAGVRVV